jgi:hypothetical protein
MTMPAFARPQSDRAGSPFCSRVTRLRGRVAEAVSSACRRRSEWRWPLPFPALSYYRQIFLFRLLFLLFRSLERRQRRQHDSLLVVRHLIEDIHVRFDCLRWLAPASIENGDCRAEGA